MRRGSGKTGRPGLALDEQRELLERVLRGPAQGRNKALRRLLEDFRGPALAAIYRTLASYGLEHIHAEDILQTAMAKFIGRGLIQFRGEAAPRTFFVRIAVRSAIDCCRKLVRAPDPLEEERGGTADIWRRPELANPEGLALRRERAEVLHRCYEELAPSLREAFCLYYLEEAGNCATIAETIGVKQNTFEVRLMRARQALARCMQRNLEPEGR